MRQCDTSGSGRFRTNRHRYAYLLGTTPEQLFPSLSAGMYLLLKVLSVRMLSRARALP